MALGGAVGGAAGDALRRYTTCFRRYKAHFLLDGIEDAAESAAGSQQPPVSLAKSLAALAKESTVAAQRQRKPLSRMERKRLAGLQIKKRVKAQYLNGKFYDLMGKVVASANTLEDAYDIVRLNSNVDLASARDDVCFITLAEQVRRGEFDITANSFSVVAKRQGGERIVLPRLNLKVIQEAVRVVLEEKIVDEQLVAFMQDMFDAEVINLVFGGFPKGHGVPQEGVLAPILMNIYLDSFDHEVFRICMKYEGLFSGAKNVADNQGSKLRLWFRSQMKDRDLNNEDQTEGQPNMRLYACRYMDEIFVAVVGSRDIAETVKSEVVDYLSKSLYLKVDDGLCLVPVKNNSRGLQFAGTIVKAATKESAALKTVHELKEKDINAKNEANEEVLLSKYIAEPALPQELRDAFNNFQKQAKDYISSETVATEARLSSLKNQESMYTCPDDPAIKIYAPLSHGLPGNSTALSWAANLHHQVWSWSRHSDSKRLDVCCSKVMIYMTIQVQSISMLLAKKASGGRRHEGPSFVLVALRDYQAYGTLSNAGLSCHQICELGDLPFAGVMDAAVHVLMFPWPRQGHINPMLHFATALVDAGVQVTFLHTEHNLRHLAQAPLPPRLRLLSIPDGLPDDHPRSFLELLESMCTTSSAAYRALLLSANAPVTCVVADGTMPFAIDIAEELGIPALAFATHGAWSYLALLYMPKLGELGESPFPADDPVCSVPGMEGFLRRRDLPRDY
uniref:Cytokinin-O-glucosyltransferase 2 n=1 Tax=Aegilops tauschii TaxID=37682 RepID=M8BIE0_AEGTA